MILDDILTQTSRDSYEGEDFSMEYDTQKDLWVLYSNSRFVYGQNISRFALARFFGLTLFHSYEL